MTPFLTTLIKPLVGIGRSIITARAKKAARKDALADKKLKTQMARETAQAKAYEQGQRVVSDWDTETSRQNANSWKDKIFAGLFISPFLAGFFPGLQPHVEAGWAALDKAPYWYPSILMGIAAWAGLWGCAGWFRPLSPAIPCQSFLEFMKASGQIFWMIGCCLLVCLLFLSLFAWPGIFEQLFQTDIKTAGEAEQYIQPR